jgi:sec-independent protein translocase protein TatB
MLVAVLVLGPEHLPRIMRAFTRIMSDFRRISTDFQRTINLEADQESWRPDKTAAASTVKKKKTPPPQPETGDAGTASEDPVAPGAAVDERTPAAPAPEAPAGSDGQSPAPGRTPGTPGAPDDADATGSDLPPRRGQA